MSLFFNYFISIRNLVFIIMHNYWVEVWFVLQYTECVNINNLCLVDNTKLNLVRAQYLVYKLYHRCWPKNLGIKIRKIPTFTFHTEGNIVNRTIPEWNYSLPKNCGVSVKSEYHYPSLPTKGWRDRDIG